MKIVVFSSHILLASHYETELEIMLDHQQAGDEIIQLYCDADLPACDTNPFFQPEACARCCSKREMGLTLLPKPVTRKRFYQLTAENRKKIKESIQSFESIEELKKFKIDDFDIGYAMASSLISYYRDPVPSLMDSEIKRYMAGTLGVYYSFLNYLRDNKTDRVYVFNGRLAHTKAALRACQKMGVDCFLHERGNSFRHYSIFENKGIHDLINTRRLLNEMWDKADPVEREAVAERFFEARIRGGSTTWYAYNKNPQNQLPKGFDPTKKNIAIFNSSEDEVASISDEWKNPLYDNQLDGLRKILCDVSTWDNYHFYLRVHPNLRNVKNSDLEMILQLKGPNFTIIPSESKISSYFLIQHVDKVLTFGSTMGMEACYLRKPSLLAGSTFYRTLGGTYDPATHEELIQLLQQDLPPLDREVSLKFGYFFSTFGLPFKHYEAEDFSKGRFLGKDVTHTNTGRLKFSQFVFHNQTFPTLSEKLRFRYRDHVLNKYLE
jgi:hypothetical protein